MSKFKNIVGGMIRVYALRGKLISNFIYLFSVSDLR